MTSTAEKLELHDFEPNDEQVLDEIVMGLSREQKTLPTHYMYDERGSQLFDQICELDEYYPTRTELGIMQHDVEAMAKTLGPDCLLIEYGSGSSTKTRLLLDKLEHMHHLAGYVPVDISRDHLVKSAETLNHEFPKLEVLPVCADFTEPFGVPCPKRKPKRRVVYFPGSTIGNFTADRAEHLLRQISEITKEGDGGGLLVGVDLRKDPALLEAAYNDSKGVTAAFNLNLLVRANREYDSNFDVDAFEHRAVWDDANGRIEMRLVCHRAQQVTIGGRTFSMRAGEHIRTEYSHKYTLDGFAELAATAGLTVREVWTDPKQLFSVQFAAHA